MEPCLHPSVKILDVLLLLPGVLLLLLLGLVLLLLLLLALDGARGAGGLLGLLGQAVTFGVEGPAAVVAGHGGLM